MRTRELTKHGIELDKGTYVYGKWHKRRYLIKRKLGSGTVGSVYLCEENGKEVALKISHQDASISVEVNVLKSLQKVQGHRLGPSLIDVDDFVINDKQSYSFYVMEYLRGETLTSFFRNRGKEWLGVLMLQLLEDLERLHQLGWVFGDLKMENLIVVSSPIRIRLIDVGGTTQIGRAVKEYTEFYDRGYWGLGSRKAEPSYDLFAFSMVFIGLFYPKLFLKTTQSEQTIFKKMEAISALKPYRQCLKKAVLGKYNSSAAMKNDLLRAILVSQKKNHMKQMIKSETMLPFIIDSGGVGLLAGTFYLLSRFIQL